MITQPQIPYGAAATAPPAPRSTPVLVLRLVATVVYFPVHAAFVGVCFAVFFAFTLVAELLSWIPGAERAWDKTADVCLNAIPMWPRWFVTVPELRHEGDAAFYRARVQRMFEHWQGGGTRWVKRNGSVFMLRVHKYRALPLDEVLRTARAYGYEPGASAGVVPGRDIALRRIADPAADAGGTTPTRC